jgi:hypothetical protein
VSGNTDIVFLFMGRDKEGNVTKWVKISKNKDCSAREQSLFAIEKLNFFTNSEGPSESNIYILGRVQGARYCGETKEFAASEFLN